MRLIPWMLLYVATASLIACAQSGSHSVLADDENTRYQNGQASRDGIGKFYMGREISHVMGHLGVGWLERSSREREEKPAAVVAAMNLAPDATVADIGAGSGYFTFRIAPVVPQGRVLAVDIQPEMLARIERRMEQDQIANVVPVRGTEADPRLASGTVDAVLMVDAYHEFAYPYEMMTAIYQALKPGGRVFLVEYRGEDPRVPIKPLHKMTEAQVRKEMEVVGLTFVENQTFLPSQHFLVFRKPVE